MQPPDVFLRAARVPLTAVIPCAAAAIVPAPGRVNKRRQGALFIKGLKVDRTENARPFA